MKCTLPSIGSHVKYNSKKCLFSKVLWWKDLFIYSYHFKKTSWTYWLLLVTECKELRKSASCLLKRSEIFQIKMITRSNWHWICRRKEGRWTTKPLEKQDLQSTKWSTTLWYKSPNDHNLESLRMQNRL